MQPNSHIPDDFLNGPRPETKFPFRFFTWKSVVSGKAVYGKIDIQPRFIGKEAQKRKNRGKDFCNEQGKYEIHIPRAGKFAG